MGSHNHIVPIAHVAIRDRNYCAHVSLNMLSHRLHVFKYCESTGVCSYEVFDSHDHARAWLEHDLPESKPKHY